MVKFGPSGSGEMYVNQGNKSSINLPAWLHEKGLELLEYSFGRGVNIGQETAQKIGYEAKSNDIEMSVHAPYFINFATKEPEKVIKNETYLIDSMNALRFFGGNRCVFHIGSPKKEDRRLAMDVLIGNVKSFRDKVYELGMDDLLLCPETMGKINQLGSVDEIINVCSIDKIFLPCIDLGHVNARENGSLVTKKDYIDVFNKFIDALGFERVKNLHIHFSHIEYTIKGGELRHLTNADNVFGPFFAPCAEAICQLGLEPHIISESAGTQDIDSVENKIIFNSIKGRDC